MSGKKEEFGVMYAKADYAGFIRRMLIGMVDGLVFVLLLIPWFAFVIIFLDTNDAVVQKITWIVAVILSVWYLALLKRSKYRTVGYVLMGVKIVNLQGEKPSVFKMILRLFLPFLGPFTFYIDLLWITSENTKQTLRDKYVGTYVVNKNAVPIRQGRLHAVTLGIMSWSLMYREVKEENIS
jgi:uncharacterized RDD family membrane protein YckC